MLSTSAENDLNSFINTSRTQRVRSMMSNSPRSSSYYPPPAYGSTDFGSQSEINFQSARTLPVYSPDDLQKMKYKIELDKQVAEKKQRQAREWENRMEQERKYTRLQPFGQHRNNTFLSRNELEEILSKGRAPSPALDMPQQFQLNYPSSKTSNGNNSYGLSRQPTYDYQPQYTNYSSTETKPQSPQKNETGDFQRFYGPVTNTNGTAKQQQPPTSSSSSSTTQPIKGDAHDPFLLFDPNKEGQNVFNIIPQQDLYDPWGRPGGGAPLVHPPTGQKFTRYSGSLQDKLNATGALGFHRRQYSGNLQEQKRDLELEQQRRQQEEMEHRSNAGDTAEWISQLEGSRYPLKLHLPTTQTTREYIGVRDPSEVQKSRTLHDHLANQAEERTRLHQMNRHQNSLADLQHTEVQNSWWGRSGSGAPVYNTRRHNVHNSFEQPRPKWTTNHLGEMIMTDNEPPSRAKLYESDFTFPKTNRYSSHKNFYEALDNQKS